MITQCWSNVTVTLKYGETKLVIIYAVLIHIHVIQTLKILPLKNMYYDVNILSPVIYFGIILNL